MSFYSTFRVESRDLSTFNQTERDQIKRFQAFILKKPDGHCSICMKILYPEEQMYRKVEKPTELPCIAWNIEPRTKRVGSNLFYMICATHKKVREDKIVKFAYAGDLIPGTNDLNYREKSVLAPVKLYSQISRKTVANHGRIGHYVMQGTMSSMHNYEFAQMAYGGTLSLFFRRGDPESISIDKVKDIYKSLQNINPLLARYKLPKLAYSLVNYHVTENKKHIGSASDWKNHALFALEDTNPQATDVDFKDLIIGEDNDGKIIRYSHPSLIALLFPHLFTTSTGHYSMVPSNKPSSSTSSITEQNIYNIPENRGGVALATLNGETLTSFAKSRLLMKDRRFAQDPSFLFFMLDAVEKKNIASANRFVVSTKGRGGNKLKQRDIVDNATKKLNKNVVSTVPPQIRSSYAYKRRNFLDLQCIFENLGSPQLFLTFSCHDNSDDFKHLVSGANQPWDDPVAFTNHWKRKWQEFFKKYILGYFANQIGGITEYSYVIEIQDRGSPHVHLILWTKKNVAELIGMNVVHTWFPPGNSSSDPLLHKLVNDHQIHHCRDSYCRRGQPERPCRFGFPKPESPVTYMDEDHRVTYKRAVSDCMVNNYNPYLLAVFRTNMDIQYNDGPQAVRYIAKYMAKDDYSTSVSFKNVGKSNQGHYQKSSFVKEADHLKTRIIGSVEATYDLLGWHKHANSRNVVFINTGLYNYDSLRIRDDVKDLPENSEDIYARSHVQIYEKRSGAEDLTMPQFFCYYIRKSQQNDEEESALDQEYLDRPFHEISRLPKHVFSGKTVFVLRTRDKVAFWRTFNQSEMNGDTYYYQQIVTKKAIFNTTFEKEKGDYHSWKDYYEYLITLPLEEGGIDPAVGRMNVSTINDLNDMDRGEIITRKELKIMLRNSNEDQKSIYNQVRHELEVNSTAFISGAAGTGKSYILRMFERYYRLKGFKVFKLAPTGVAAHNITGQTLHRFFGMANRSIVPNFQTLDEYIKLYPKIILLIDEYSMISAAQLNSMNDALIKTTNRATIMGGVKTIFFGDIAQLLPVEKNSASMWNTSIYNYVNRYDLINPVRQKDEYFIHILNKVRLGFFQEDVIQFINKRTVHKKSLPLNCLRLYTTRERVQMANEKDFKDFPGDEVRIKAIDTFVGTVGTARRALKETRLSQELLLKVGMPVMLIQNMNIRLGWVNGTIASISDIDEDNIGLRKFTDNDEENGEEQLYWVQRITRQVPGTSYVRSQFPVIPAFASTIHKAQSATIDCVGIYLDNMLTHGQLYVAMSRVKNASDLFFFGASIPLAIKRKYGVNVDAINISRKKVCVDE